MFQAPPVVPVEPVGCSVLTSLEGGSALLARGRRFGQKEQTGEGRRRENGVGADLEITGCVFRQETSRTTDTWPVSPPLFLVNQNQNRFDPRDELLVASFSGSMLAIDDVQIPFYPPPRVAAPQTAKENSNRSAPGRDASYIPPFSTQQKQHGLESRSSPPPAASEVVRVRNRSLDSSRETNTAAAAAQQDGVRGDDCTTSSKTGGARRLTAACQNALGMTASVLRVEGAASPAQSKGEDGTALLREHGTIWGSGDVEGSSEELRL